VNNMTQSIYSSWIFRISLVILILGNSVTFPKLIFSDDFNVRINVMILALAFVLFGVTLYQQNRKSGIKNLSGSILKIGVTAISTIVGILDISPDVIIYDLITIRTSETLFTGGIVLLPFSILIFLTGKEEADTSAKSPTTALVDIKPSSESEIVEDSQVVTRISSDIFISFSSKDITVAERTFKALMRVGKKPWISTLSITVGQDYGLQIVKAIDNCRFFVLLITKNSIASRHVKTELERAFSKGSTILPIKLDDLTIPLDWEYYLSGSQWMEVSSQKENEWLQQLVKAIVQDEEIPSPSIDSSKSEAPKEKDKSTAKCLLCSETLSNALSRCPNCGQRCEICKRAIHIGEDWTTCSSKHPDACLQTFHETEYIDWIKVHGKCPYCRQLADPDWYNITKDASIKVALFIAQTLHIDPETPNFQVIENNSIDSIVTLARLSSQLEEINVKLDRREMSAIDRHYELVKIIQPLSQELELIRETSERIDANMVTEDHLNTLLDEILSRFDTIEDNVEILVEAHRKNSSLREKIKQGILQSGGEFLMDKAIEDTGIRTDIENYTQTPTKNGLRSIVSKISNGLKTRIGKPKGWLKIASMVLLI